MKLFDSELKIMDVLWKHGEMPAKDIAYTLAEEIGWNKNTTYTVIKKCIAKGAIERSESNFLCKALIKKSEIQEHATTELINKIFDGSADLLFSSILNRKNLSKEQIQKLKDMVNNMEEGR